MTNKIKNIGVVLTRSKLKQVNGGGSTCCGFTSCVLCWLACCGAESNDTCCPK